MSDRFLRLSEVQRMLSVSRRYGLAMDSGKRVEGCQNRERCSYP